MQLFVSLNTVEDFKTFFEYLSELYNGTRDEFEDILTYGFDDNYKKEYDYMNLSSILIPTHYDDDTYEEVPSTWKDNWSKESREWFLGDYFINFVDDWDRCGDVKTRFILKIEEPKYSGIQAQDTHKRLIDEYTPLGQRLDLQQREFTKCKESNLPYSEMKNHLHPTDKDDLDRVQDELANDFGIGFGLK